MKNKEDIKLSDQEIAYYQKQLIIPQFGIEAQKKLKEAKVLVVGLGGLGSPCAQFLTSAGIGHLGLIDGDIVEEHNLQRQILYSIEDVGKKKVDRAFERLSKLNPYIKIETFPFHLDASNAKKIIENFDIIVDGTDNFQTRYLVNDTCVLKDKINVYASIFRWEGQLSVFNYPMNQSERGPNYRDLFPKAPVSGSVPNCSEAGILGAVSGILGSWQALETIKIITGQGNPLKSEMLVLDLKTMFSQRIKLTEKTAFGPSEINDLSEEEMFFCESEVSYPTVSAVTLHQWMEKGKVTVIDVREREEFEKVNIGGKNIPLGELKTEEFITGEKDKIVFICQSGKRSVQALDKYDEANKQEMYSLEGGIDLYKSIF